MSSTSCERCSVSSESHWWICPNCGRLKSERKERQAKIVFLLALPFTFLGRLWSFFDSAVDSILEWAFSLLFRLLLPVWRATRLLIHKCTAIWRSLSRQQSLAIWATASIILLEIMYPCLLVLVWADRWVEVPQNTLIELREEYPWVNAVGNRKLISTLQQWRQDGTDLKEWPDFRRMIAEAGMTALIGGGFVLI